MAVIDLPGRRIHGKIVYYGPGYGGKTTNLRFLEDHVVPRHRRRLKEIADETGRTIFCDTMPLDLGRPGGVAVGYDLYTVAGQAPYADARSAVLEGADGVVFVADARADRIGDNRRSLDELVENLVRQGKNPSEFPLVLQYNKMDLAEALPAKELNRSFVGLGAASFEAAALTGIGVVETLREICRLVTRRL